MKLISTRGRTLLGESWQVMGSSIRAIVGAKDWFSVAVADELKLLEPRVQVIALANQDQLLQIPFTSSETNVLLTSNPATDFCQLVCQRVSAAGSRLVPLFRIGTNIYLGPISRQRNGPCWACAVQRIEDNLPVIDRDGSSLEDSTVVRLLASGLCFVLNGQEKCNLESGSIFGYEATARRIFVVRVTGRDACVACGLGRKPEWRTVKEMRDTLSSEWGGISEGKAL